MTKLCNKCLSEKDITLFVKNKKCSGGYRPVCKSCRNQYISVLEKSDPDKYIEKDRIHRLENSEYYKNKSKVWRDNNIDRVYNNQSKWYLENRDRILEDRKEYSINNRDIRSIYHKNKMLSDPLYKLTHNIRSLIYKSISNRGYKKNSKTFDILGCSFIEFKEYIGNLFRDGMSWENMGKWHFDHKIPISYAINEEEVYKLNHYTNFQPLWAKDNLSKGNRYTHD